jgi:EAL domain-containing protein (putative c-di-GMP-specific phosphodiesterase class I)
MYEAKRRGGGIAHYDATRDQHSRQRLQTINELRVALEDPSAADQLVLHYQPQVDVRTGRVVGTEALVRWQHPTRGLLAPDTFLPLVEQTGLMPLLTSLVLRQAVRQCEQWRLDGWEITVSVNLSASSLLDQALPEQVAWLLTSSGLPSSALVLEITESTIMTDPDQAQLTLERLRDLGIGLSIDDYGTGYCSLSYLQNLPVSELKLDRAFLADLRQPRNAAIVRSTIELAHALDLRLVAEGIEDADTLALLDGYGCDTAQGYHLGRPGDAASTTTWLRRHRASGSPSPLLA